MTLTDSGQLEEWRELSRRIALILIEARETEFHDSGLIGAARSPSDEALMKISQDQGRRASVMALGVMQGMEEAEKRHYRPSDGSNGQ